MKRILLMILFCMVSMGFQEAPIVNQQYNTEIVSFPEELNDSTLYQMLLKHEIKYPTIVLAQAKLETGDYTSHHCVKGNNLFGLYDSRNKRYFSFENWEESVKAYKSMIEYKHKDGEDYYDFLVRIKYATDPTYISKVRRIENNLKI